ncbi:MAG TPA: DUF2141 domain-containing protein [Phormidium sp.]
MLKPVKSEDKKSETMLIYKTLHTVPALLTMLLTGFTSSAQQPSLQIDVLNVQKNRGKIIIELYKNKSNWLKSPFQKITVPSDEVSKTVSLSVPQGKYAVSIYQDTNGNGELDQNFLGIPKEPIGFGNNYKPFGKPKFESALIELKSTAKPEAIKLFSVF